MIKYNMIKNIKDGKFSVFFVLRVNYAFCDFVKPIL